MVFAQQFADDTPLTLLRRRRAEADVELRKSIVKASMCALTLCVAVLLARALVGEPQLRVIDLPPTDYSERVLSPPPTAIDESTAPPARPVTDPNGVQPVDEVDPEVPVPDAFHSEGPPPALPGTGSGTGLSPAAGTGTAAAPPADPSPDVYTWTETLPDAKLRVKPEYPGIACDAGMEGKVTVRMLVGVDGRVKKAEVESKPSLFDDAALAAARQWIYTPATTDGRPVPVWTRVPFVFTLH
jgi:protein TonB